MSTTDEPDDHTVDEPTGELNQHLVDVLKQALSQQDPSIDWSKVKFGGFGPNSFIGLEHSDPETDAKLVAAFDKLKADEDTDLDDSTTA